MKSFAVVLIFVVLASSLVVSASASAAPTRTPIKHVIFIMKENHSFDNYFELYPEGINGSLLSDPIVRQLSKPYVAPLSTSVPVYPGLPLGSVRFSLSTSAVQQNPGEGWVDYHGDWDYGRMDGWVAYSGPQSMVYLSERQLSAYWDYAEEYVLFDNWFSPAMTETLPNRLFSLAGI
ncbi:MAG: alkaline phosphatase family protein, partial [Thermoprotei archaeon]